MSDNEVMNLADLAGLDMDTVEEQDFASILPVGVFVLEGVKGELDSFENADGEEINKCNIEVKVVQVVELAVQEDEKGNPIDPNSFLEKVHRESFWLGAEDDMAGIIENVGKVKKFLSLTGFTGQGSFQAWLDGFTGHQFAGVIKHRKNKNDPDIVYANLNYGKIQPLEG